MSTDSNVAYDRVVRIERLMGNPDFQWFLEKANAAADTMKDNALNVSLPMDEANIQRCMHAGARALLTIPKIEHSEAVKALKEAQRKEDPATPKKGTEL